jgi:hypothetical protein
VGKNIPSARDEEIKVRLQENDGVDEVVIINNNRNRNSSKQDESSLVREELL